MTVEELIKELQKMPQDYDVVNYVNICGRDIRVDISDIIGVNNIDKTVSLDFV